MNNFIKQTFNPLIIKLGERIERKKFSKPPVIIGACPRSGTTLLLSILSAHPEIFAIGNQTYAFANWDDQGQPKRRDRLYREFLFRSIPDENNRWCEKTPKNIVFFKEILNYFPKVRVIHLVRDGRDVVTSRHPRHNPDQYWVSPARWVKDVRRGLDYKDHPDVLTLFYENLIDDFERQVAKVCDFIGIDFHQNFEHWTQKTSIRHSKHWKNPVQNLHSRAIGKWEKPEHQQRIKEFYSNPKAVALLKELHYM